MSCENPCETPCQDEVSPEAFRRLYQTMPNTEKWLLMWSTLATLFARLLDDNALRVLETTLAKYLIDEPPPPSLIWELAQRASNARPQNKKTPVDLCQTAAEDLMRTLGLNTPINKNWSN